MSFMPKRYPPEFRDDVIAVARAAQKAGTPLTHVAADFGITSSCLRRWLRLEAGSAASTAGDQADLAAENRQLKAQLRRVEQEREILRRAAAYFAKDVNPK